MSNFVCSILSETTLVLFMDSVMFLTVLVGTGICMALVIF